MGMLLSLVIVLTLVLIPYLGIRSAGLYLLFGAIIPYIALVIFLTGVIYRVIDWGRSPVPFRIPTTGGQQFSLPWIKKSRFDNPNTLYGVIGRMLLEVFLFRSLFRNTKSELKNGGLVYGSAKWLWLFGLIFHWSFLLILIRHFRFFSQDVPILIATLESLDGFFQVGIPFVYITDILILSGVTFLFLRRVIIPQVKYISLPADYFPLFLIMAIATTGILMRYFIRVDIVGVKEIIMGLVSLNPQPLASIGVIFYIHIFLVSCLFMYFPFSKLMHLGGVLLSPTRNLANNSRMVRHINPWDYPVPVHTYEEYEREFKEKMKSVGLPVEKE